MASVGTGHWAGINEVSFVAGMRVLFWIFRLFGRWPFRVIVYPVLLWYVATQDLPRRASGNYLRRVQTLAKVRTGWFGIVRHFGAFAEMMLDKMLLWGDLFDTSNVVYAGREQMQRRIDAGQGGVIMCTHLGNLDLCRVLSRAYPQVKLTLLVHTKHARAFNHMLAQLNPHSQMDLLQVTEMTAATAILLAEKIAQGGFVVIAGDRVPVSAQPRVVWARFLGQPAQFPIGPYVLASVLQCPLFLMFSLQMDGAPQVHFELLRESIRLSRKGRDEMLKELATDYAVRLEHFCARAPLQWFNFYDFWSVPASHLSQDLPLGHDDAAR